jgi:hypothetical protein
VVRSNYRPKRLGPLPKESSVYKETYNGLDFDTNWGSLNTYTTEDGTRAIIVEWRTDRVVKSFSGENAYLEADRWAYELHYAHDLRNN